MRKVIIIRLSRLMFLIYTETMSVVDQFLLMMIPLNPKCKFQVICASF